MIRRNASSGAFERSSASIRGGQTQQFPIKPISPHVKQVIRDAVNRSADQTVCTPNKQKGK